MAYRRTALQFVMFLSFGCFGRSGGQLEFPVPTVERSGSDDAGSWNQAHDFGTILSEGQSLRHEFSIRNPSHLPMRLIRGEALTPCCSSLGPLPDSIPPHGAANVLTIFSPGFQSGPRGVVFAIQTDSEIQGQVQLALRADLVSAWEAVSIGSSTSTVPLGQPGTLTFRVVARRKGSLGRGLPDKISSAPPVRAAFGGHPTSNTGPDGTIEVTRDVVVSLPATDQPGIKRGELAFAWPDGRTNTMPLSWEVRPRLRLLPAGIVLQRSSLPVERTIVMESEGIPFRVVGVSSPLLARSVELPAGMATRHAIHIELSPSNRPPDSTTNVIISTDHPDQSSANISVLVLPEVEEKGG